MNKVLTAKDIIAELKQKYDTASGWAFFSELRLGTGYKTGVDKYIDAYAISCWGDLERIAYEIKVSKSDFNLEMRNPSKRRPWLALSNRFYFVTPKGLLKPEEVPADSGLIEIWEPSEQEWAELGQHEQTIRKNTNHFLFSKTTIIAPWHESVRPNWRFLASIARRSEGK